MAVTACSGPTAQQELSSEAPSPASAPAANTDIAPAQTVRQFLDWYVVHTDSLAAINLVTLDATAPDSLEVFTADYAAINQWLAMVQRSHKVSTNYLNHWRTHFHSYADTLRLHPQGGPPEGFNYDFIMLSQEPDTDAADLRAGTFMVKRQQANKVLVEACGPKHASWQVGLDFILLETPDRQWQIDSIGNASSTF